MKCLCMYFSLKLIVLLDIRQVFWKKVKTKKHFKGWVHCLTHEYEIQGVFCLSVNALITLKGPTFNPCLYRRPSWPVYWRNWLWYISFAIFFLGLTDFPQSSNVAHVVILKFCPHTKNKTKICRAREDIEIWAKSL